MDTRKRVAADTGTRARTELPARIGAASLRAVAEGTWRVTGATGRIIGHLRASGDPRRPRFTALRYHPLERRLRAVGEFWSAAEAVECLRLSR